MLVVLPGRWRYPKTPIACPWSVHPSPFLTSFAPARLKLILRLLRLLRLAPLVRRTLSTQGLKYTALLAALTAVAGGAAFAEVEGETDYSLEEGIFFAVTT